MEFTLRVPLLIGVSIYLFVIFYLLKKEKLSVQYSIIWIFSGVVMLLFAIFPYIVLVMGDILQVVNPVNFVFMVAFVFVLFILLSLSAAVSIYGKNMKRMAQHQALLERRVRELECELKMQSTKEDKC